MFSPGRSVNLQDCSFPSCSSYPPHILKNRRVSRRDTRLVSRFAYIYIYMYSFFFRLFFPRISSLRFVLVRISTATSSRDSPTTELSSLFFPSRMLPRHVIAEIFRELAEFTARTRAFVRRKQKGEKKKKKGECGKEEKHSRSRRTSGMILATDTSIFTVSSLIIPKDDSKIGAGQPTGLTLG